MVIKKLDVVTQVCPFPLIEAKAALAEMALWSLPLPWIAIEAGWFMTEFGRQPWAIQDILPTYSAHSALTTGQLAFSLIMIVGLYTLFLIAEVYLMQKYARLGPSAMQSEQPTQQQG